MGPNDEMRWRDPFEAPLDPRRAHLLTASRQGTCSSGRARWFIQGYGVCEILGDGKFGKSGVVVFPFGARQQEWRCAWGCSLCKLARRSLCGRDI